MSRPQAVVPVLVVVGLASWAVACGDGTTELSPPIPPRATALSVTPAAATLTALDDTVRLTAQVRDQNGQPMAEAAVTWSSGNASVAAVDAVGLVTAVGNGPATIEATSGAASGSAAIVVEQAVREVEVSPNAVTLVAVGDTVRLTAVASDANGHAVEGAEFNWSSSDGAVATVTGSGLVRGLAEGTSTITALADEVSGESEITVQDPDRAGLVALFKATDGPNWIRSENWLTDAPLRAWHGVGMVDGRVSRLNLRLNGLRGPIPPEIGNLTSLTHLGLDENALTGPIPPELGRLTRLRDLNFNGNALTGSIPSELGRLAHLEHLRLNDNELTGPIPPELGQLVELRSLWLARNRLSGAIPPDLGNLTRLESLELNANARNPWAPRPGRGRPETRPPSTTTGLSGPIPGELGKLTRLETLYLDQNELTGMIPPELGALTHLRRLNLYWNALSGPIPPDLGSLASLEYLDIRHNQFSGPIPPELVHLERLETFHLHYAGIGGDLCASDPDLRAWLALFPLRDGSRFYNPHGNQYSDDFLPCGGPPDFPPSGGGPAVRVFYAIPSDVQQRQAFVDGIRQTVERMRWWYSVNLDGATFHVVGDLPEICRMPREEKYYHDGVTGAWPKVFADVNEHCADGTLGASDGRFTDIVLADVYQDCTPGVNDLGAGRRGLTMMGGWDLYGQVTPRFYQCGWEWGIDRWIGGFVHEVGHAFGLPHPPGCDAGLPPCDLQALMYLGYDAWPHAHMREDERAALLASPFIR